jgi:hypothetical protein
MIHDNLNKLLLAKSGDNWFFRMLKNKIFIIISTVTLLLVVLNFIAPLIFSGFLGKVDFIDFNAEKSNKEVLLTSRMPFFVKLPDSNGKVVFSKAKGSKHSLILPKKSGKITMEYGSYFDYYTNKILSSDVQKLEFERDFDGPIVVKGSVSDAYDNEKNEEAFYFDKAAGLVKMTPENPYCEIRNSEEPDKTYKVVCEITFSNSEKNSKSKSVTLSVQDELGNVTYIAKDKLATIGSPLVLNCNSNGSDEFVYNVLDKNAYSVGSNDGIDKAKPFLVNGKDGIRCKSSTDITLVIPELNNKVVYIDADKPAKVDLELKEGETMARTIKVETKSKIKKEAVRYYNLDKTPPTISKYDSCIYKAGYLPAPNEHICLYTSEKVTATYNKNTYYLNNQIYNSRFKANSVNIDVSGYYKDNQDSYLVLKDQAGNQTTYNCTVNTSSKTLKCDDKVYQYATAGAVTIEDKGLTSSFEYKGWKGDD